MRKLATFQLTLLLIALQACSSPPKSTQEFEAELLEYAEVLERDVAACSLVQKRFRHLYENVSKSDKGKFYRDIVQTLPNFPEKSKHYKAARKYVADHSKTFKDFNTSLFWEFFICPPEIQTVAIVSGMAGHAQGHLNPEDFLILKKSMKKFLEQSLLSEPLIHELTFATLLLSTSYMADEMVKMSPEDQSHLSSIEKEISQTHHEFANLLEFHGPQILTQQEQTRLNQALQAHLLTTENLRRELLEIYQRVEWI